MRLAAEYGYGVSNQLSRLVHGDAAVPAEFGLVCLWAVLGLTMVGLIFALGFGAEVVQALAVAG